MIIESLIKVQLGQHLTEEESFATFCEVMNGEVVSEVVLSALLTAGYLLTVTIHGFFPGKGFDYASLTRRECGPAMLIPMILCVAFTFLGGMFPQALTSFFGGVVSPLF